MFLYSKHSGISEEQMTHDRVLLLLQTRVETWATNNIVLSYTNTL